MSLLFSRGQHAALEAVLARLLPERGSSLSWMMYMVSPLGGLRPQHPARGVVSAFLNPHSRGEDTGLECRRGPTTWMRPAGWDYRSVGPRVEGVEGIGHTRGRKGFSHLGHFHWDIPDDVQAHFRRVLAEHDKSRLPCSHHAHLFACGVCVCGGALLLFETARLPRAASLKVKVSLDKGGALLSPQQSGILGLKPLSTPRTSVGVTPRHTNGHLSLCRGLPGLKPSWHSTDSCPSAGNYPDSETAWHTRDTCSELLGAPQHLKPLGIQWILVPNHCVSPANLFIRTQPLSRFTLLKLHLETHRGGGDLQEVLSH